MTSANFHGRNNDGERITVRQSKGGKWVSIPATPELKPSRRFLRLRVRKTFRAQKWQPRCKLRKMETEAVF
jgi:hypothetical protein